MAERIGVIGPEEFVLGFQLAGVRDVVATKDADGFRDAVDDVLAKRKMNEVGILIVDAKDVESLPPTTRRKIADTLEPVVVQMGGQGGDLREKVKRAIGIDVYKE